MGWDALSRDQRLDLLLEVLEVSNEGVIRFKPKNADGQPHQRMAIGRTGLSVSDDDPNPHWYASGNAYFGGRVGIQSAVGFELGPVRTDLRFAARHWQDGFPSSLQVENNNITDQVTAQFWQTDTGDDGLTGYVVVITTADSARPTSRNTALRLDAVNDQGHLGAKSTGLELNLFGADVDNRGIDVSGSSTPTKAGVYTGVVDTSSMSNAQYVTSLYQTLLLRDPEPAGLAGWVDALAHGATREQVKAAFLASAEYQAKHP